MITLSALAVEYLSSIVETEGFTNGAALRLGVTTKGCEGSGTKFRYEMGLETDAATPNDVVFNSEGINIYVDNESLPHLDGLQLDIKQHHLGEVQFLFRNPNAKQSCGCGHTFSGEQT